MPKTEPATKGDVFWAMLIIAVLIFLAARLLLMPTRDAVLRIEQKVNQCQP